MITNIKKPKSRQLIPAALLALTAIISGTTSAQALQVNFGYTQGMTVEQMLAFEMAGDIWSSYLTDDVTVNINVGMTNLLEGVDLPENVIGGALPEIVANQSYQTFMKGLKLDLTSANDYTAYQNLPTSSSGDLYSVMANNSLATGSNMSMTRANMKALGIVDGHDAGVDGYIVMSDLSNINTNSDGQADNKIEWGWDLTRSKTQDSPTDNTLDFLTVALHEVGHVLGFVSASDDPNAFSDPNAETDTNLLEVKYLDRTITSTTKESYDTSLVNYITPLDAFRVSTDSSKFGALDLSQSAENNPFFSVDGGTTNLGDFAQGQTVDGDQGSHWKRAEDNPLGIMDPVLKINQTRDISNLDLQAMDVIGWDFDSATNNVTPLTTKSLFFTKSKALLRLSENLNVSVFELLGNYNTSFMGGSGWWMGGSGWWQQADLSYQGWNWQHAESPAESIVEPASVPEPSSALGLLGIALLGIRSLFKSRRQ